jgi:hypothetical protein
VNAIATLLIGFVGVSLLAGALAVRINRAR